MNFNSPSKAISQLLVIKLFLKVIRFGCHIQAYKK